MHDLLLSNKSKIVIVGNLLCCKGNKTVQDVLLENNQFHSALLLTYDLPN